MSTLFGGARARASQPEIPIPEAALRMTTSVQGKARPIGWGRNRVGGNLIWLGGFRPYLVANYVPPQVSSAGGKGGGSRSQQQGSFTFTWNYLVDVALSLCEGTIVGVVAVNSGNAWTTWTGSPDIDSQVGADHFGAGNLLGPLLYATMHHGGPGQGADPAIAASFPSQALTYRGEAYLAIAPLLLGTNTNVPQMSFDVIFGHSCGLTQFPFEAYPGDVVLDYLTNPEYGVPGYTTDLVETPTEYNQFCGANSLLVSPILTDQVEASSFVSDLLTATHSAIFMSGGKLRIRPYAEADANDNGLTFTHDATPIYDLAPQDFLPGPSGGNPIDVNRKQPQEMANNLRVEYLDRDASYAPAIIETRDEASIVAYGIERQSDVRTQHFFCRKECASVSAAFQLQREQISTTYTFNLPREFELLDPMDLLTLPLDKFGQGQPRQAVRIIEIVENDDYSFTITAEEYLGTADMPLYARQATTHNLPDFNAQPGDINPPIIFELPPVISNGLNIFAALSGGDVWGGCEIWASYDDVHYNFLERIFSQARMGVTTNSIGAISGTANVVDFTNILSVDLSESRGTLISGSADDMLNASTRCYLETGEIISFTLATLGSSEFHYDLQPLMRGCYGSPILSHSAGEKFVRLDGSITAIPYDATKSGQKIYLKFLSFNQYGGGGQGLADVPHYIYTIGGKALEVEDVSTIPFDAAAVKDFVDTVNGHKETVKAVQIAGETSAKVGTIATAVSTAYGAIASLDTRVEANFNNFSAFVDETATALSDASGSVADLTTQVGVNGAWITFHTTAISTINGKMSARYSLELNVSGRITGFYVFADQSGRSDFAVAADKFQIWATGYANTPVFEVDTIGGTAALTINGRKLGDLSALTDSLGNNAVSNGALSSGTSGGLSGTASLTVRNGSRVILTGNYVGGDAVVGLGVYTNGVMDITYTPAGGGATTQSFQIPGYWNTAAQFYFNCTVIISVTSTASGTWTAQAHSSVPSISRNLTSGATSILIQEFKK
jgi:hypothetical protein